MKRGIVLVGWVALLSGLGGLYYFMFFSKICRVERQANDAIKVILAARPNMVADGVNKEQLIGRVFEDFNKKMRVSWRSELARPDMFLGDALVETIANSYIQGIKNKDQLHYGRSVDYDGFLPAVYQWLNRHNAEKAFERYEQLETVIAIGLNAIANNPEAIRDVYSRYRLIIKKELALLTPKLRTELIGCFEKKLEAWRVGCLPEFDPVFRDQFKKGYVDWFMDTPLRRQRLKLGRLTPDWGASFDFWKLQNRYPSDLWGLMPLGCKNWQEEEKKFVAPAASVRGRLLGAYVEILNDLKQE